MAVNYSTAAKVARMQAVLDLINVGAGTPDIVIQAANDTILVIVPMDGTNAGSVAGEGVLTFDCTPALSGTAIAGSPTTATKAYIRNGDTGSELTVISGLTVGVGTGDIQLDSTSITTGQTVTITSAVITHAIDT